MIRTLFGFAALVMLSGCTELLIAALDKYEESNSFPIKLDYRLPGRSWRTVQRSDAVAFLENKKILAAVMLVFLPQGNRAVSSHAQELADHYSNGGYVVGGMRDEDRTDEYGNITYGSACYYQTSFRLLELASPHRLGKVSVRDVGWTLETKISTFGIWPAEADAAAVADFDALVDSLAYECR